MGYVLKPKPITGNSPSDFNTQITLERPATVPDGMGGFTATWVSVATIWAIMTGYQSDEMVIAMQSTGTVLYKIRIRYRTDVQASWHILHNGKYLTIIGPPVNVAQGNRFLDLRAREAA